MAGGRHGEALELLSDADPSPTADSDRSLIEAFGLRLDCLHNLGRWEDIVSVGTNQLHSMSEAGLTRPLCSTHAMLGVAHLRLGNVRKAEEHLRAAIHIARWDLEDQEE